MSQADRDKWNERYRSGTYVSRTHPSALLTEWLPKLGWDGDDRRALDVACGRGRNSVYLARERWQVDAVDISNIALDHLSKTARSENLSITCFEADLGSPENRFKCFFKKDQYDLGILIRYTNLSLLDALNGALKDGAYLIVEEHLVTDADVVGPQNSKFRVAPGALLKAAAEFEIVSYREGIIDDPDGRPAALAQLVARKTNP
jgi:tellurite methyltransferase